MWDLIGAKNGERERERERTKRIENDIKRETVCVKRTKRGLRRVCGGRKKRWRGSEERETEKGE